ncbi:MAG: hypothetical protein H6626_02875 [Pseudobdellovibrionaceae bacterium]|nr:MAG: hypothetical protein H6626_02875 [Pseudobdellovibrionaceae bacterium]
MSLPANFFAKRKGWTCYIFFSKIGGMNYQIKWLLFGLLLFIQHLHASPKYINKNGQFNLELGEKVKKTVKEYDANFEVYKFDDFMPTVKKSLKPDSKQNFVSVIGDMNGDKVLDVILSGYNKKNDILIAVVSSEKEYKVIEISKGAKTSLKENWMVTISGKKEYGLSDFISYEKPRKVKSPYEKDELDLKNDAFSLNFWEKSSTIYYFKNGKFEPYTTSD